MTLYEQLLDAQTEARKARNAQVLSITQVVCSQVKNEEIANQKPLTDEQTAGVVARQVKQLKDALADFQKAGRSDLVEKTQWEISFLEKFLPEQASDEEIEQIVRAKMDELGVTDASGSGRVMGAVMSELKGKADGGRVKAVVEHLLNKS